MAVGMVVAVELDSIFDFYGKVEEIESTKGFSVYKTLKGGEEIYIIHSGAGIAAASAGTQHLISKYNVDTIVNFGVVGGLTENLKKYKVCIVSSVVHYRYDASAFADTIPAQVIGQDSIYIKTDEDLFNKACEIAPELIPAVCCSGDVFVDLAEDKAKLHKDYGGDICDMESAGIILTCEANSVPCLMIKAISDGLMEGAKEFNLEVNDAGTLALSVMDKVLSCRI